MIEELKQSCLAGIEHRKHILELLERGELPSYDYLENTFSYPEIEDFEFEIENAAEEIKKASIEGIETRKKILERQG